MSCFNQQDKACAEFCPLWGYISLLTHSEAKQDQFLEPRGDSSSTSRGWGWDPSGASGCTHSSMEHPHFISCSLKLYETNRYWKKPQGTNPTWNKKTLLADQGPPAKTGFEEEDPPPSQTLEWDETCAYQSHGTEEILAAIQSLNSQKKTQELPAVLWEG